MSKKLISVMLALVMVLSVFSVTAFAVRVEFEDPDAEETYTQIWYLDDATDPDENGEFTVDIYLEADYYVGAISFSVEAIGATLVDVIANDTILDEDGYKGLVELDPGKKENFFDVFIIPQAKDGSINGLELTGDSIATLVFALDEGSASSTVTLYNDAKTVDNMGKLIAVRLGDNTLASETMYYGQDVLDIDENAPKIGGVLSSITVGEEIAEDPELVPVEGSTGYVDNERMYVYGVPVGTSADNFGSYFEATNNGYFEMSEGSASATNGTGATLTLYNESGVVFEEYTLIIFGDVNSDGEIDTQDSLDTGKHANFVAEFVDDYIIFAADVNADEEIDTQDSLDIGKHANFVADLPANVWA